MKIKISSGEILDKFSIISIKFKNITNENKLINIRKEFKYLEKFFTKIISEHPAAANLYDQLKRVNQELWNIEKDIRIKEDKLSFDNEFIDLARRVYKTNDERARIKKEINILTLSNFMEEKSYYE